MSDDGDRVDAQPWIDYAHEDLAGARMAAEREGGVPRRACADAQQAMEKFLKAVICADGRPPPRTHDLPALVNALPEDSQDRLWERVEEGARSLLDEVSQRYLIYRYPAERSAHSVPPEPATWEEAESAILLASELAAWAQAEFAQLRIGMPGGNPQGAPQSGQDDPSP
ncbi:MAG: HEPN domain-containing protein [Gammaproteobacteria bacterium]|nr:HEPN domain-containing protein [Gammaproteobacteria bacterium]MDE0365381.1 HEPN domain-containing protein [Gammaproteobacteria bacterium]